MELRELQQQVRQNYVGNYHIRVVPTRAIAKNFRDTSVICTYNAMPILFKWTTGQKLTFLKPKISEPIEGSRK